MSSFTIPTESMQETNGGNGLFSRSRCAVSTTPKASTKTVLPHVYTAVPSPFVKTTQQQQQQQQHQQQQKSSFGNNHSYSHSSNKNMYNNFRTYSGTQPSGGGSSSTTSLSLSPSLTKTITSNSSTTSTCNSFLLGGAYYPGKDKKKRTLLRRKTTLWYRILFSSPSRFAVTVVVSAFFVCYFIILPTITAGLFYLREEIFPSETANSVFSNYWKKRKMRENFQDSLLTDPTLRQTLDSGAEYLVAEKIAMEREQIRKSTKNEYRMKVLEAIAPDWYHRNELRKYDTIEKTDIEPFDNNVENESSSRSQQQLIKNEGGDQVVVNPPRPYDDNHPAMNLTPESLSSSSSTADETPSTLRDQNKLRPPSIRTLHTSNAFINNSHCPRTLTAAKNRYYTRTKPIFPSSFSGNSQLKVAETEPSSKPKTTMMIQTTLIVQTSYDRLWILSETCSRWFDPIIAVLALQPDEQQDPDVLLPLSGWKTACPQLNLIVYNLADDDKKETISHPVADPNGKNPKQNIVFDYPVNLLRNLALDAADTSHVLIIDIDFVPSYNLHENIRTALEERYSQYSNGSNSTVKDPPASDVGTSTPANWKNEAIVVPAFEKVLNPPCTSEYDCKHHLRHDSTFIPYNYTALEHCYHTTKDCTVFQSRINPDGHSSTRTDQWFHDMQTNTKKTLRKIDCFDSLRYEPYVVLPWCPLMMAFINEIAEENSKQNSSATMTTNDNGSGTTINNISMPYDFLPISPYYDERFHGYGKNKIQHVSHLRFAGYQFLVLTNGGFIVHNPHLDSSIKHEWEDTKHSTLHRTMDKLYETFLMELTTYYISPSGITTNTTIGNVESSIVRQCDRKTKSL